MNKNNFFGLCINSYKIKVFADTVLTGKLSGGKTENGLFTPRFN
jgi:hypothetical protein